APRTDAVVVSTAAHKNNVDVPIQSVSTVQILHFLRDFALRVRLLQIEALHLFNKLVNGYRIDFRPPKGTARFAAHVRHQEVSF
ncbi:MAG TPA: hypothetical protein VLN48_00950, partial [Bryobacteraceae bacterium]|nr:hypothetical protein [Bryobacteraceae bacterium]